MNNESGTNIHAIKMARAYRDGNGVSKNLIESTKWYRVAASNGSGVAKNELFEVLIQIDTPDSISEAVELVLEFASDGNGTAALQLAKCYVEGKGLTKNIDKAIEWALIANQKGVKNAKSSVLDYLLLKKTDESTNRYFELATEFASTEDVGSMGRLGRAYRDGIGTDKDRDMAIFWFRKASDKSKWWTTELCDLLLKTNNPDYEKEAFEICTKLMNENDDAKGKVGMAYLNGKGTPQDVDKGLRYLREVAEKNVWWSNELYDILIKMPDENYKREAFELCVEHILNNNPGVYGRIARSYLNGNGTTKNIERAEKWYILASKNSNYWKKEYEVKLKSKK